MPTLTLNLTATGATTRKLDVRNMTRLAARFVQTATTYAWGAAVAKLQYSVDPAADAASWADLPASYEFSSGEEDNHRLSIGGVLFVRFVTKTSATTADPSIRIDTTLSGQETGSRP